MNLVAKSIFAVTLLTAAPAFAADTEFHSEVDAKKKADGQFDAKTETKSTNAAGTTTKTTTKDSLDKTLTGSAKLTSKAETVTDPKGVGNTAKQESEVTITADDEGNSEKKTTSHSVDAAGTTHKKTTATEVDAKADGTKEIITSKKEVVDPKGLGNKTVVKNETVKTQHPDGTVTHEKN